MSLRLSAAATRFGGFAEFVGGNDSGGYVCSGDGEGHEVDGFVRYARFLRNGHEPVADILYAEVGKTYGKSNFEAEADDFVDFLGGRVLENELADGAERDLLAVEVFMCLLENGKSVVNGVRRGKTAGLKAQTGQQNVGLYDILESGSNLLGFAGKHSFVAVGKEVLVAEGSQRESGFGASCKECALGTVGAAGKTCVDVTVGLHVGASFEISGERVAHARYEETYGSVGDNGGIDKDHAGALLEICVIVESSVRSIENGGVRGRRIGSGYRGADDERIAFGDAFRGVDGFTAAETYRASAFVLFGYLLKSRHFLTGTFAGEVHFYELDLILRGSGVEFRLNAGGIVLMRDEQSSLAEGFDKVTEVEELVFALNVLGGANKCFSHYEISFY